MLFFIAFRNKLSFWEYRIQVKYIKLTGLLFSLQLRYTPEGLTVCGEPSGGELLTWLLTGHQGLALTSFWRVLGCCKGDEELRELSWCFLEAE